MGLGRTTRFFVGRADRKNLMQHDAFAQFQRGRSTRVEVSLAADASPSTEKVSAPPFLLTHAPG